MNKNYTEKSTEGFRRIGAGVLRRPFVNLYSNNPYSLLFPTAGDLKVTLINQVHHHLNHYILFFGLALSNHQSKGYEGIIGKAFGAVRAVKNTVAITTVSTVISFKKVFFINISKI